MNTKALKQKILDLAIHGKLLPLDKVEKIRKEEPASILLEKIRAEKQEKIAKGELKKDKKDSFIFLGDDKRHYEKFADGSVKDIEDEIPFELPDGWSWCRLGEIGNIVTGSTPSKTHNEYYGNDYPFYKPTDLEQGLNTIKAEDNLSEIGFLQARQLPKNSVLVTCIGATIGKTGLIKTAGACNQQINAIIPNNLIIPVYIFYACLSDFMQDSIISNSSSTTLPILNKSKFATLFFPLPPLAEQQLIVSEIEKIFAQIDLLEQNKTDLQTAIKQAKSKILNLAIHGKLVSQDPNDEPASILLEKIRAEKEAKIAKGELKKDKKDSFIFLGDDKRHYEKFADGSVKDIEDEIPFDIPDGWSWCRLKEICTVFGRIGFRGYTRDDLVQKGKGAITLSPSNLINMKLDLTDCTYISWSKYDESPEIQLEINDVVVVKTGSSYGKTALVDNLTEKTTLNPQLMVLKERKCNSKYLCYFLNTQYMRKHFEDLVNGTAIPTFSQEKFGLKFFPLPPLSEQQRIVSKIEEIFAILDRISSELGADI